MAFSGAGPIWSHSPAEFVAVNWTGDQAGYNAAVAAVNGILFVGPGLEALALGALGANVALLRVTNAGLYAVSKFAIADGTDPTKLFKVDVSAITTGTTRTAVAPNYGGFLLLPVDLGASGQFLKSNGAGVQPSWAAVTLTNALLDGANHTDTVAQAVLRGALVIGNSTPKWDRLAIGAANTVLTSNGTDPSWSSNPALDHSSLSRLTPFIAANCTWANGSANISTTGGAFANVRVGDFVYPEALATTQVQGARIATWTDSNNIVSDIVNTGAGLAGVDLLFQPGDHWNNTIALDTGNGAGLLVTQGRGTYTTNAGGTYQELRGPIRWMGAASGSVSTDFDVVGSVSTVTPSGFCIRKLGGTNRAYFYPNALTGNHVYSLPNADGKIVLEGTVDTLLTKTLTLGNKIATDGTATYTVFQNPGGADRLGFDLAAQSALQVAKWQDWSPSGHVDFSYISRTTGIDAKATGTTNLYTVPAGKSFIFMGAIVRCTAATAITVGPSYGIGVAAGEDDMVGSATYTTFTAADTFLHNIGKFNLAGQNAQADPMPVATAAQVIKIGIDTAATGTSMTLAVDIHGYLV